MQVTVSFHVGEDYQAAVIRRIERAGILRQALADEIGVAPTQLSRWLVRSSSDTGRPIQIGVGHVVRIEQALMRLRIEKERSGRGDVPVNRLPQFEASPLARSAVVTALLDLLLALVSGSQFTIPGELSTHETRALSVALSDGGRSSAGRALTLTRRTTRAERKLARLDQSVDPRDSFIASLIAIVGAVARHEPFELLGARVSAEAAAASIEEVGALWFILNPTQPEPLRKPSRPWSVGMKRRATKAERNSDVVRAQAKEIKDLQAALRHANDTIERLSGVLARARQYLDDAITLLPGKVLLPRRQKS
jgi:hypothetical protein